MVCFPERSTQQCARIWLDNLQLPIQRYHRGNGHQGHDGHDGQDGHHDKPTASTRERQTFIFLWGDKIDRNKIISK